MRSQNPRLNDSTITHASPGINLQLRGIEPMDFPLSIQSLQRTIRCDSPKIPIGRLYGSTIMIYRGTPANTQTGDNAIYLSLSCASRRKTLAFLKRYFL